MNKRAKGKLLVNKVKSYLEADGWMVEVCRPRLMFIGPGRVIQKEEDFWGAWDILAIKKERFTWTTRLIQVSTVNHLSSKKKQVEGFPHDYGSQEIWLWVAGRGCHFRIFVRTVFKFIEDPGKIRIP